MFPVKKRSGSPFLSKSATATPPPLKIYSSVSILNSVVSVILLLKSTPVCSESKSLNSVSVFEQE